MARQVVYIDDIDGSEGAEEVTFMYKGQSYAIDLGPASRERFDKAMSEFISAARKGPAAAGPMATYRKPAAGEGKRPNQTQNKERTQAVRDWGRANGFEVSDRGRIPAALTEAFDKAHARTLPEREAAINRAGKPAAPPLPTAEDMARAHEESKPKPAPAPALFSAPEVKAETPPQPGSEDSGNDTPDTIEITTAALRQWIADQGTDPAKVKFLARLKMFKQAHPGAEVKVVKELASA